MKIKKNLSAFKIREDWKRTINHEQSLLFVEIRRTSRTNQRKKKELKKIDVSAISLTQKCKNHLPVARALLLFFKYLVFLNNYMVLDWFFMAVQIKKEYDFVLLVTLNTHYLLVKRKC